MAPHVPSMRPWFLHFWVHFWRSSFWSWFLSASELCARNSAVYFSLLYMYPNFASLGENPIYDGAHKLVVTMILFYLPLWHYFRYALYAVSGAFLVRRGEILVFAFRSSLFFSSPQLLTPLPLSPSPSENVMSPNVFSNLSVSFRYVNKALMVSVLSAVFWLINLLFEGLFRTRFFALYTFGREIEKQFTVPSTLLHVTHVSEWIF